ncbi:MAG TPA: histidine kinase dimerization/phospho-acceptor domain-containing protein [Candidatus Saccharimonadales bacterium]|nr:histidine kinase dimerization/phospho-acceptor domain-containing protein [Candidatus Saccharimonadales bacterium]
MIQKREHTILLVSDDPELCTAARREFEARDEVLRVAAVRTVDAARRIVEDAAPTVILLEHTSITLGGEGVVGNMPCLNSVVSSLAMHAPVVVIGARDQLSELAFLVEAGAADFVERRDGCLPIALEMVERRLRHAQQAVIEGQKSGGAKSILSGEAFGEVLRHEMNNPLTGILGNAELLLAEVRRKNDGRLPHGGQQRLETIAALAVRLRETVRRLSQECQARQHRTQ